MEDTCESNRADAKRRSTLSNKSPESVAATDGSVDQLGIGLVNQPSKQAESIAIKNISGYPSTILEASLEELDDHQLLTNDVEARNSCSDLHPTTENIKTEVEASQNQNSQDGYMANGAVQELEVFPYDLVSYICIFYLKFSHLVIFAAFGSIISMNNAISILKI